jgi:hypothetical protein
MPAEVTMTAREAVGLFLDRDAYIDRLARMSREHLIRVLESVLASQGIQRIYGSPGTRDELISDIMSIRFPSAKLNEAIHVQYHAPGLSSSACQWCHPHSGGDCDCELGR